MYLALKVEYKLENRDQSKHPRQKNTPYENNKYRSKKYGQTNELAKILTFGRKKSRLVLLVMPKIHRWVPKP